MGQSTTALTLVGSVWMLPVVTMQEKNFRGMELALLCFDEQLFLQQPLENALHMLHMFLVGL